MKRILIALFTATVLTACSQEETVHLQEETVQYDYTFQGEGEYWEAEYSFNGKEIWREKDGSTNYSNENSDEFVLTYKGSLKEFSSMKTLEYSYETSAGSGSGTREFDEPPKEVTFKNMGRSVNGAKVSEDEAIQVNVKWNEYEESFQLHKKNK